MSNSKDTVFSKHTAEFRNKASALGHDMQELGRVTKDLANDTLHMLKDNANDAVHQGMEKAQKLEKTLETKIKENPLQALLIAAGVGFVIGAWWRRR